MDNDLRPSPAAAKKLLMAFLAEQGILCARLSAKSVDFTDLARGSGLFVMVHQPSCLHNPDGSFPTEKFDAVKAFAKTHHFIVQFTAAV